MFIHVESDNAEHGQGPGIERAADGKHVPCLLSHINLICFSILVRLGSSEAKDLQLLQARQRARQRRECAASLRVVCDMKAKLMQRREGLDAQLAKSPRQGSELAATFELQAAVPVLPHRCQQAPKALWHC
jgi:hypothetical protein